MSNTISIQLDYPVELGTGETLTTLNIRRAKAKDILHLKGNSETEQGFNLLATLTGLVPEDLEELDIADFTKASKVVEQMVKGKSAEKI